MKKIIALYLLAMGFATMLSANIDYSTGINEMGKAAGAGAGGLGLAVTHFFNGGAIILGLLVAVIIVGYYFQKVDQEKRGVGKNILAVIGAMFAGLLVMAIMLSVQTLIYGNTSGGEGCGPSIFATYMSDATKAGLGGTFGEGIKAHPCLNK